MRQVAALVPAEKTQGLLLDCELTRPAVLGVYQLVEVFAFGGGNHGPERRTPVRRVGQLFSMHLRAELEFDARGYASTPPWLALVTSFW